MAFTTDDVAKLERAIARGHKTVRYGDRTVEYHSMKEMRDALAQMRAEVEEAAGTTTPARRRFFRATQTGRGY